MATELETLAANIATVKSDLEAIVPLVETLKQQVIDLTAQLAAAQAAGFDVPDEIITASNDLVAQANSVVASLSDAPASVVVEGGGPS